MDRGQSEVQRKVEFENERVRVIRYRFAPHAGIPMHEVPDLVAIWLTEAHLQLTFPDGTRTEENHQAGDIAWAAAQRHSGMNLADAPLEFISVQLKGGSAETRQAP